jgi:hypothetical protein
MENTMRYKHDPNNPYEQDALQALAASIIKQPERKNEFEKHVQDWITAYTFYREENEAMRKTGAFAMENDSLESQVRGIDFNHPVKVGAIPPPGVLVQFQAPTTEGKLPMATIGNYWGVPGQTPAELGLSDYSKLRDPAKPWQADPGAQNVKRTTYEFTPKPNGQPARALFTTAGPIVDNWSRRTSWAADGMVTPVICPGGGQQMFSMTAKNQFVLKPGQEQQLTVEQKEEALFEQKYGAGRKGHA